jgi:hypothetical protein
MDFWMNGLMTERVQQSIHPKIQQSFMPQREFDITIAPDGSVEVHVKGYKGKSCLEAMKIFEQVVGEMKSQRETSEFYEPDEQVRFNIEQRH